MIQIFYQNHIHCRSLAEEEHIFPEKARLHRFSSQEYPDCHHSSLRVSTQETVTGSASEAETPILNCL